MKLIVHKFKPSGKWYDTFELECKNLTSDSYYQQEIAKELVLQGKCTTVVVPSIRTIDDWFIMTMVSDLPIILWIK